VRHAAHAAVARRGSTHTKNLGQHFQRRQFDAIDKVAPRLRAARVVAHEQRQDVSRFAAAIEEAVQAGRRPGEPDEELEARVARRTTGGGSTNGGRAAVCSGRGPSGEAGHGRGNRSWGGYLQTGSRPSTGACGRPGGAANPPGGSRWRDDDGKARSSYGGDGGGPSGGGCRGRRGGEDDRHAGSGYGGGGGGTSSGSRHVGGSWQDDASSPSAYGSGGGGPSGGAPRPRRGSRWDEEEHRPSAYGKSGCVPAYRVVDGRGSSNWEDAGRHHESGYGGGTGGPSRGSFHGSVCNSWDDSVRAADGYGGRGGGPSRGTQGGRGGITCEDDGGTLAVAVMASSRGYPVTNASPADRAGGHDGDGSSAAGARSLNAFCGEEDRASSVKRMRVHMGTSCAVPSRTTAVPPTARVWIECDHCRSLWNFSSDFEPHAVVCAATTPAGEDEEGQSERGGAPDKREPARDGNGEGWEGRRDEGKGKRPASSRCLLAVAGAL